MHAHASAFHTNSLITTKVTPVGSYQKPVLGLAGISESRLPKTWANFHTVVVLSEGTILGRFGVPILLLRT